VFSEYGLINEYVEKATALRKGRRVAVPGLSEIEEIDLPDPLGRCEAAHAAGGLATMAYTYEGKVQTMDYKVIRYPGHFAVINGMKAMGFFDKEMVEVDGVSLGPKKLSAFLFRRHFSRPRAKDLVVLKVMVRGWKGRKRAEATYTLLDKHDERTGLSAMMRTTGFPASIVAQMMAQGKMRPGAYPIELGVPAEPFFREARKRGFKLSRRFRCPA
ncbi:saccharopine dehydrogenase family protein, partial [Elusimicrobiota bacterium]